MRAKNILIVSVVLTVCSAFLALGEGPASEPSDAQVASELSLAPQHPPDPCQGSQYNGNIRGLEKEFVHRGRSGRRDKVSQSTQGQNAEHKQRTWPYRQVSSLRHGWPPFSCRSYSSFGRRFRAPHPRPTAGDMRLSRKVPFYYGRTKARFVQEVGPPAGVSACDEGEPFGEHHAETQTARPFAHTVERVIGLGKLG